MKNKKINLKKVVKRSYKKLGKVFLGSILFAIILTLGIFLFVIPGIIFALFLYYTLPVLVYENRGVIESLKYSWNVGEKNIGVTIKLIAISVMLFISFMTISLVGLSVASIVATIILVPVGVIANGYVYLKKAKFEV